MDDRMDAVKAELEAVSFVGETLAPFFLQDPRTGTAGAAFQAVAQLRAQEAADAWPFADGAEARHALSLMVNGLADGIDADDLVWEYRRLFVGPAPKPAPPWGSVYTDRECVVFGEGTLELRAWMRAHGVRRTTDERTPRITSASCWRSCPTLRATSPTTWTNSCKSICLPGRRTSSTSWSRRRITRSMKGSPGLRRPRSKAFSKHATST